MGFLFSKYLARRGTRISKRRSGQRVGGRERKRRRHHLYLVFDDWSLGYSIRKVDSSPGSRRQSAVRRLPRPFFRLQAPHGSPEYFASAFGTNILSMHPRSTSCNSLLSGSCILTLDVRSRAITFGPRLENTITLCPRWKNPINPIYLAVDNKLFTLSKHSFEILSLDLLSPVPPDRSGRVRWSWEVLTKQPFKVRNVTSYALNPYSQSFLVSTTKKAIADTFAFDTVKLSWKQVGKWALPFHGRGHFDPLLGAFVGLSKDPDTFGQLYFCYMPSSDTGHTPKSKLGKMKLLSEDPAERHVSATLVYMGRRSKFCLIECVSIEGDSADQELKEEGVMPRPGRCLYRLTTFSLSHDMNGDPTTGGSCRVQYYKVPEATTPTFLFADPVVFWM
ncbi:hypothetical protein CFC21_103215 [Triticum aestivum]|uniref:Uncharacterized protein n=3 Tax=Triticum TaxID=4564 RepID=A0A9R1C1U6_TRITD|nr:uncharacterized protein LOC123159252 [Triticum aestivum]KAF7102022.1 hypothetical protein CFC21_103215 [Triticum aestivum]VAI88351.1 unnamed protein product [Triticum turgidum subsp. durum]